MKALRSAWVVALLAVAASATAGVDEESVVKVNRRGDADCSVRANAADVIATARGLGGASVCGNDDCDHDGTATAADVDCTARCLFGQCAIPAHAPAVLSIEAELTPEIVPLSSIRIRGRNLGADDSFHSVTIGGIAAVVAETEDPDELLVVVPDLPPGTYPLVVSQNGLAGAAVPITLAAPTPIGPTDTAQTTLFLLDEVLEAFLGLDLEEHYGVETGAAVRASLEELRPQILSQLIAFTEDATVTAEQRARVDAALDASGVPERLRQILAEIHGGGAAALAGEGGASGTLVVGIARQLGSTIVASAGLLELLGTISAPHLAAIAHLLGIGVGVVLSLPTLLTPVITEIRYVDAQASVREFPTAGGFVQVRLRNFAPDVRVHLIARTAHYELDLVPDATGASIQYRLPEVTSVCGPIRFAVENEVVGYRSSTIYTYIQPEIRSLAPSTVKPEQGLRMNDRGVGSCGGLATFAGRSPASVPLQPDSVTNVVVPNILPGNYKVGLLVAPIASREQLPVRVDLAITGVSIHCDLARLAVLPNQPYRTECRAAVEPAGAPAPPGTVFVWSSSDTSTAAVVTDEISRESVVTALQAGTTNITATLQAPDNIRFTSNAVPIEVVDAYPPVIRELSSTAMSPVPAGGSIPVHVRATDNDFVTRIVLHASGDAVVAPVQEFPCIALEGECEADFTVTLKASDFTATNVVITAEAFDGAGNHQISARQLTYAIGGDASCPAVSITSPADRSTVSPGATGRVNATATDNLMGDTGVAKFIYSATGDALAHPIVDQELPVLPMPLPLANLGFNFEVKSAEQLASVSNRNITIRVQAVDAAGNKCDAQVLTLTVAGSGDVQITLVWSDTNDLDLRVVEPSGTAIYYGNRMSETGGRLDVDANVSCSGATTTPVENIFWPVGQAPTGLYRVIVSYYAGCPEPPTASTFTVKIRVDGVDKPPVTMSISSGVFEVATFTR